MAVLEDGFLDGGVVDVGAVGGTQIAEYNLAPFDYDLAMGARDGRVVELEVVGWAASEGVGAGLQVKLARGGGAGLDNQSRHSLWGSFV